MASTFPYMIRISPQEKRKLEILAEKDYRSSPSWLRAQIHKEFDRLPENAKAELQSQEAESEPA